MSSTRFTVEFTWWDGRERPHVGDFRDHSVVKFLGTGTALDSRFNLENFTCGHTTDADQAENDGKPRDGIGIGGAGCDPPSDPSVHNDADHPSDNFDTQLSTPIGWWRFQLAADDQPVPAAGPNSVRSGRGLVGVVLTSPSPEADPEELTGQGVATRLWHEDPCEIAQSGETIGPPHKGHGHISDEDVALFNTFSSFRQSIQCGLIGLQPFDPRIILPGPGK
jgi:hypothetical protein